MTQLEPWSSRPAAIAAVLVAALLAGNLSPVRAMAAPAEPPQGIAEIRQRVLSADPERLARLGRHLVAGIDDMAEVRRLIEARAIAGVFVTQKNLEGRTARAIRAEVDGLQALRRASGLPPLWIAADQEGGTVERLSPPLPRQPPLSRIVASTPIPVERKAAILDYATRQGRALAGLGVNVNFAPVVDLDHGIRDRRDVNTRIWRRVLAWDALAVAEAASWYCDGLREAGVTCTRKHFPGLGRVAADTHVRPATLATPREALAVSDWLPFREPAGVTTGWTMLGHVRIEALDPDRPASASKAAVDVLRRDLGVSGIVITDDFSMGAIRKSPMGTGAAAVAALNAGVDLILVSFYPRAIYVVLDALLAADAAGLIDGHMLDESARRLDAAVAAAPHTLASPR